MLSALLIIMGIDGYSAMLPEPMEWEDIKINWSKIKEHIQNLDLDNYQPFKPLKILTPKNRANIRIVHLLHPQDIIIYTALVLIVKNDIETKRIHKKKRRVFSYRVDLEKHDRLYEQGNSYELYINQLRTKSAQAKFHFIGIADIADFYPRIYQHRLENAIQTVAEGMRSKDVARVLVKKLISNLMERNSYGIPVGPYASRILAECVLIDVDSFLYSNNVDFIRWVDDYSIFCKSEREAQSHLFRLGEWLFNNHGLTLQSAKTKILPAQTYIQEFLFKPEDRITDRDRAIAILKESKINYNYESTEETDSLIEEEEVNAFLERLQNLDMYRMLTEAISDRELVDYEVINYILTRLAKTPGISEELKRSILSFILDKIELFYPVSEQVSKYIISLKDISFKQKKQIAKKILSPLMDRRHQPPNYYAMWMLYIFSTSEDWEYRDDIINIYQNSTSTVVKRYAALAISKSGTRSEALVIKDDISSAPALLRLAILKASQKLGKDERIHWKLSNQIKDTIETVI